MKIALIHDHLAQDGGAEKVLREFTYMFPEAPIYTLLCEWKNASKYFAGRRIETSIIQKLPGGVSHYQWYMPFMPMAVEFFDLRSFDVVLSDASAFAKGVITSTNTFHICYCHTPTRYLWDYSHQYIQELKYNKYFKKLISIVLNYIRLWDRQAADRVDFFVANSETVKRRIAKYYRRDSVVVYPPVDVMRFRPLDRVGDYYFCGGRLSPYKRIDIVIAACRRLGRRLKIYGDGIDRPRLESLAQGDPLIEFLGRVTDEELPELYGRARAFVHPQDEDFGITAVESMAAGRPVIAYGQGGATETILDGQTGVFFERQRTYDVVAAIEQSEAIVWDSVTIRERAELYSTEIFRDRMSEIIEMEYKKFKGVGS